MRTFENNVFRVKNPMKNADIAAKSGAKRREIWKLGREAYAAKIAAEAKAEKAAGCEHDHP